MRKIHLGIVMIVVAALFAGRFAPAHADAAADAQKAGLAWLALVDGGKYADSYKQASSFFKKNVTEAAWVSQMTSGRAGLGKVNSRKLAASQAATTLPGAPNGEYYIMQFSTSFKNKPNASELVTVMKDGGTWRMAGYYIK